MQIGRTLSYAGTAAALTTAGVLTLGGGAAAQVKGLHNNSLHGVVTGLNSNGFEILLPDTSRQDVLTNRNTVYGESGSPDAVSGVAVGEDVAVQLVPSVSASAAPIASRVDILLDAVRGKVVSVSGSSITLSRGKSSDRVVLVTPSTKYFEDGSAVSGAADGERVVAYGTPSDGQKTDVTAWYVDIRGGSFSAPANVTVPSQQPAPTGPASTTLVTPPSPSIGTPTAPTTGPTGPGDPQGLNPGGPMQTGDAHIHGGRGR
jgi:hypothetical protein